MNGGGGGALGGSLGGVLGGGEGGALGAMGGIAGGAGGSHLMLSSSVFLPKHELVPRCQPHGDISFFVLRQM